MDNPIVTVGDSDVEMIEGIWASDNNVLAGLANLLAPASLYRENLGAFKDAMETLLQKALEVDSA